MILIGLAIVFIVIFYDKINTLEAELKRLKEKEKKFCPYCGASFEDNNTCFNHIAQPVQVQTVSNNVINKPVAIEKPKPVKKQYTDKEIKNNLILITGSVLLILAAILFLTTTWNITNNILKSGVLVAMLLIFIATSHIADKYLHLSNTSKAFHYIALAYLPIVLLSLSFFGLIGEYFSINGEGKYVYLTFSSFMVTAIYYYFAFKKGERVLGIISMIFSILTVLLLGACFTKVFSYLLLFVVVYLLILILCYKNNVIYFYKNLHFKSIIVLLISLIFIAVDNSIFNMIMNDVKNADIITHCILLYSAYYFLTKVKKYNKIFDEIYPLYIMYIFFNIAFLTDSFIYGQILMIASFAIVFILNILEKNTVKETTYFEVLGISLLLVFVSFVQRLLHVPIIPEFILFFIMTVLTFFYHSVYKKKYNYPAILATSLLFVSLYTLVLDHEWNLIVLEYSALAIIVTSLFFDFDKKVQEAFKIVGIIVFNMFVLFALDNQMLSVLLLGLYLLLNIYLYYKERLSIYKILGYIYSNLFIMTVIDLIGITDRDAFLRVIPITTIILIAMELLYKKLSDIPNMIYIIIQAILSFMIMVILKSTYINLTILILLFLLSIIYIYYRKMNGYSILVPFLFLIPHIYYREFLFIGNINIMFIISTLWLIYFAYSNYMKEDSRYMVLYFMYTLFHVGVYNSSNYISLLIVGVGLFINYLINKGGVKDLFKGLLYTNVLFLVEMAIFDLGLSNITCIHMLPYLVFIPLVTRLIIIKYDNSYKLWEYLGYIGISITAFFQYTSEADGMLFVTLLTAIVIIAYIIKIGPVFAVSLFTILINVVLLTRSFWLGLPWWLYILVIGAILVGFAIYNELNEKKKDSLITKVRNRLSL